MTNNSGNYNKNHSSNGPTNNKKYEDYNVVSETRDSIFNASDGDLINNSGQIYVSEDKIREIVQRELDKRLGVLSNTNGNGD